MWGGGGARPPWPPPPWIRACNLTVERVLEVKLQRTPLPQGPANKYISLRDRRSRRGDTIFGAKFSIRLFRYYIKFLNKENMHTYSYGVLLYSDGRMPPLVALFADLYQFCTRYVKSNNDLCSADVLTWRVLRAI